MSTKTDKKGKKGGTVMGDVSKLVVPFGILLAEKSLNKLMKATPKAESAPVDVMPESRKAAVGGKKKTAKKGGGSTNLMKEFNKLSGEIEKFLAKH